MSLVVIIFAKIWKRCECPSMGRHVPRTETFSKTGCHLNARRWGKGGEYAFEWVTVKSKKIGKSKVIRGIYYQGSLGVLTWVDNTGWSTKIPSEGSGQGVSRPEGVLHHRLL